MTELTTLVLDILTRYTIETLGLIAFVLIVSLVFARRKRSRDTRTWMLVDGSNVMHWADNTADLNSVRMVVDRLRENGFRPAVIFDANVGYKIIGRYMNEGALAQVLNMPRNDVLVSPKGKPADPILLEFAEKHGAQIVTNDQFRDWQNDFAAGTAAQNLIKGRIRNGRLHLNLPATV